MSKVRTPFDHVRQLANRRPGQPAHKPADTVQGGYGTVPAAKVDTTAAVPAPRGLSPKEAEKLLQAELLQAARELTESTTELTARLGDRRGAVNGVLLVRLVQLDAAGQWHYTGQVAVGSVAVENLHESEPVYVGSGDSSPAGPGLGVHQVAPGRRVALPIAARSFAVTGPAGGVVNVQAFTGLQALGVGL